ncbi:MAG TPA: hypothetical protein VFI30_02425 [Nocardioidaceae bacterium]|nr:hypothetical protein [Nocardioidaceae bacterium]
MRIVEIVLLVFIVTGGVAAVVCAILGAYNPAAVYSAAAVVLAGSAGISGMIFAIVHAKRIE